MSSNKPSQDRIALLSEITNSGDLKLAARELPPQEIVKLISLLIEKAASNAEYELQLWHKIHAVITGSEDIAKLQAAGQALNASLAAQVLEHIARGDEQLQKSLPPLLVGMSITTFIDALLDASPSQMEVLIKEANTEPLQHQLYLCIQALEKTLDFYSNAYKALHAKIMGVPHENVDRVFLLAIEKEIESLRQAEQLPQYLIRKALALAWNTTRSDLISQLSHMRERYHKFSLQLLGHEAYESTPSTGLYKVLQEHLDSIFTDKGNNEDAAIDALAIFSIWYLQDYWAIGLLPHISNLDHFLCGESDDECALRRGQLFEAAKQNLAKIGLYTLKNLKDARIYSKKCLREFISDRRQLLE